MRNIFLAAGLALGLVLAAHFFSASPKAKNLPQMIVASYNGHEFNAVVNYTTKGLYFVEVIYVTTNTGTIVLTPDDHDFTNYYNVVVESAYKLVTDNRE